MQEYIVDFGDSLVNLENKYIHEPVVRSRDCKHYDEDIHSCDWWSAYERLAEPDGFCAWGEREES